MRNLFKISDAAVIALHAVDLMGRNPAEVHSAAGIADKLGVSYNHLSKVMQRLTRAGYVTSLRGPRGGFALAKKAHGAALRDIIEAIEGPLDFRDCLMETPGVCGRSCCLFSELLSDTNRRFENLLAQKVPVFVRNR